jgi:putative chitinase
MCFACDFVCPAFGNPFTIATALDGAAKAGKLKFDQLINEHDWVHISFDPRMRGQCLTLRPGRTYEPGIKR